MNRDIIETKLMRIKKYMGFNNLEITSILSVSNKTIENWLDRSKKTVEIHCIKKDRLNNIYAMSEYWNKKDVGHIGNILNKPFGSQNTSLLNLMMKYYLDLDEIYRRLDYIASIISKKS